MYFRHGGSVRRFKFSKHFDSKKSRVWTRDINCPLHALDLSTCSGWGDFIGCNSWLNGPAIIVCRAKPLKGKLLLKLRSWICNGGFYNRVLGSHAKMKKKNLRYLITDGKGVVFVAHIIA